MPSNELPVKRKRSFHRGFALYVAPFALLLLLVACSPTETDERVLEAHDVDKVVIHFTDFDVQSFGVRTESSLIRDADLHLELSDHQKIREFVARLPSGCAPETRPVARPENLHALIEFYSDGNIVSRWRYSRFDYSRNHGPLNCRMDGVERDAVRSAIEFIRQNAAKRS